MNISALKQDIFASITVALVAIPLCLGIALACHVPLISGIISGIVGGIVVGFISQSKVSVSGPAAGMVAVVIGIIAQLQSYELFLVALTIAGFIQILAGIFQGGFVANYIPTNVIQGLLAAIGILIIVKQIPIAIGYYAEPHALTLALKTAEQNLDISYLINTLFHIHALAIIISGLSMLILLNWEKCFPKVAKVFPASVAVIVAAITINECVGFFTPGFSLHQSMLVNIPVKESFSEFLKQFEHPDFSQLYNTKIYTAAIMIAAIASLETLLNIEGIEKIDKSHRYTSRDRELVAQGAGNVICGLLGGLPVTSVIVRSSVNIYAGAKSKLSTILHGFILLISIGFLGKLLNYIPLASLAAILIHTGYKLANITLFKKAYHEGYRYFLPFLITTIAIIFTNLITGIFIGLSISIFFILYYNSKNGLLIVNEKYPSGNVLRFILPQQITFLNKAAIVNALNKIQRESKIVIDANSTSYIDNDVLNVIKDFKEEQAPEKNILLNLTGFKAHYDIKDQIKFINATTRDVQKTITHQEALKILIEGNKRFIHSTPIHKDFQHQIQATARSQHPIAVILSCIDSRVPVEIIFDLNLGDLFVVRIAGNIANVDIIGSIEFACQIAQTKLVIILGHKECGAIQAACDNLELGNMTQLIKKIKPAIEMEESKKPHENKAEFLDHVIAHNVALTKKQILKGSEILNTLLQNNEINVVGAIYDIHTGQVVFDA
ncbi:MAG: SulP family inorganic anion transporter [Coxiellaceae bacterium]|nr:SulP family inorganic anion transporter [Coxiellaceae bacterium]